MNDEDPLEPGKSQLNIKDLFSNLFIADFKLDLHVILSHILSNSSNITTIFITDDHKSLLTSLESFIPDSYILDLSIQPNINKEERFLFYLQKITIITTLQCTLSDALYNSNLYLHFDKIIIVLFTCKIENYKKHNTYNFLLTLINDNYKKFHKEEKENYKNEFTIDVNIIINSTRLVKKITKQKHFFNFINNFKINKYYIINNQTYENNNIKVLNNLNNKEDNNVIEDIENIQERTFKEINSIVKFNNNSLKDIFYEFLSQKRTFRYLNHLQKIIKFDKDLKNYNNKTLEKDKNTLDEIINKKFPGYLTFVNKKNDKNQFFTFNKNNNDNKNKKESFFINRNQILFNKLEIYIQLTLIKSFILQNDAYFVSNYINSLVYSKNLFFSVSESFKSIKQCVSNLIPTNQVFNKLEILFNFVKELKTNERNKENSSILIICNKRNYKSIGTMLNLLNSQKDYRYIQNAIQFKDYSRTSGSNDNNNNISISINKVNNDDNNVEEIINTGSMIKLYIQNDYLHKYIKNKIEKNDKENIIICFDYNLEILNTLKHYKFNNLNDYEINAYIIQNNFKEPHNMMKEKLKYIKTITENFKAIFKETKPSNKVSLKSFIGLKNAEVSNLEITIDKREFKSTLPFQLYKANFKIIPKMLITGDYIIKNIIIERKSFNDLVKSIMNLRLLSQTSRIMKQFNTSFIVIEKTFFESYYFGFLEWLLEYYKIFDVNIIFCGSDEMTIKIYEWLFNNTELLKAKYEDNLKKTALVKLEEKEKKECLKDIEIELEKREEITNEKNKIGFEFMELIDGLEKSDLEFIKENKISMKDLANHGLTVLKELFGNIKGPKIYKFFNEEI